MKKILVSIIIPSFNSTQWVCNAVDCCLRQTYQHHEVIVVDDGSTDDTHALMSSKYGDKVRYVYQKNRGLAGARNTGLRNAKGDYIQFLDADDLIHPDKIRTQVEIMVNMPSPSVTYTDYCHCDINDHSQLLPERHMTPVMASTPPIAAIAADWETRLSIPVHCFLFDAAIFRQHGVMFDESLPNHEDWDCWMKVFALKPEVSYIPEKMALYCIRADGMCRDLNKMRKGFLMAIKKQQVIFSENQHISLLLNEKEKEIRSLYKNHNPFNRMLCCLPDRCRATAQRIIPWRIQRMFD